LKGSGGCVLIRDKGGKSPLLFFLQLHKTLNNSLMLQEKQQKLLQKSYTEAIRYMDNAKET
jgi:hypothetical protein